MITVIQVRTELKGVAPEVGVSIGEEGLAFTYGLTGGKPFDFAIVEARKQEKAFVRLTRFRIRTSPKQPKGNTIEAIRQGIETREDLDIILLLAKYSLGLHSRIEVNTTDSYELARTLRLIPTK